MCSKIDRCLICTNIFSIEFQQQIEQKSPKTDLLIAQLLGISVVNNNENNPAIFALKVLKETSSHLTCQTCTFLLDRANAIVEHIQKLTSELDKIKGIVQNEIKNRSSWQNTLVDFGVKEKVRECIAKELNLNGASSDVKCEPSSSYEGSCSRGEDDFEVQDNNSANFGENKEQKCPTTDNHFKLHFLDFETFSKENAVCEEGTSNASQNQRPSGSGSNLLYTTEYLKNSPEYKHKISDLSENDSSDSPNKKLKIGRNYGEYAVNVSRAVQRNQLLVKKSPAFTEQETIALLKIWIMPKYQDKFNQNAKRHSKVWKEIALELFASGINSQGINIFTQRTAEQVQNRFNYEKAKYSKAINAIKKGARPPPEDEVFEILSSFLGFDTSQA